MNHNAIRAVYPNAHMIDDVEGVFDIDGNKIEIDETVVAAKAAEIQAKKETAKQAAQAKLAALGLTPEDLKALLG